jgi:hypothetical protein
MRARTAFDNPFREVLKAVGWTVKLTVVGQNSIDEMPDRRRRSWLLIEHADDHLVTDAA